MSRALIERGNWQEAREEDNIEKCNFLWRPFNYPAEVFKRIEKRIVRNPEIFIYNHFEVLKGLVTKSGLIRSLKQFYFNHEPASKFFMLSEHQNTKFIFRKCWIFHF